MSMKAEARIVKTNLANLTQDEALKLTIERAKTKPSVAMDLLKMFAERVHKKEVIPNQLLRYVAHCFDEIWKGTEPKKALHLVGSSRGAKNKGGRDMSIAVAVYKLRNKNCSLKAASREVAKEFKIHLSSVEGIVKNHSKYFPIEPRKKNKKMQINSVV